MLWGDEQNLTFHEAARAGQIDVSEQRAMQMLASVIPAQLADYQQTGEIIAVGQITGETYIIRRRETVAVPIPLSKDTITYCIHSRQNMHIPPTDDVIALYLLISYKEDLFLKTANNHLRNKDPFLDDDYIVGERSLVGESSLIDELLEIQQRTERAHEQINREREEWLANAYDYKVHQYAGQYKVIDGRQRIIRPPVGQDQKRVIEGLATYCLADDYIESPGNVVSYNSEHGSVNVPLIQWRRGREIDNTFLMLLLSAYADVADGQDNETCVLPDNPYLVYNKVIMSAHSYQQLISSEYYDEFDCDSVTVLIDDRVGNFVFFLHEAESLGVIAYGTMHGAEVAGLAILEPSGVKVRAVHNGRLVNVCCERAIDEIYSFFPENCEQPMEYDRLRYKVNTLGETTESMSF